MSRKKVGSLYKRDGVGAWIASWYDHDGRRREHSTRTTDRAAAERILAKLVADAALRRDGVVDARQDRFAIEGRKALTEHVADYIAHCRHAGQAPHHVDQKETLLRRLTDATKATRLADLTADALVRHLATIKDSGRAARSVNFVRQIAVAFLAWCMRNGRVESNPLSVIPKQDEARDRRRVRRPLTDEELGKLLKVARERGRDAWYLAAALAGLRKGDLQRLTWADVDLDAGTLTIRHGKAKREDVLPLHPQLADALRSRRDAFPGLPTAKVFPDTVGDVTRRKDFLRAGIARTEKNEAGKVRIVVEDAEGRVIDLHALRTTLGTQLARAGVAPQVAQRLMRHSDYKTTLRHYTVLGIEDTSRAIAKIPGVKLAGSVADAAQVATGTAGPETSRSEPQRTPQRTERETVPERATRCDETAIAPQGADAPNPLHSTGSCANMPPVATPRDTASGRSSAVERQLPKQAGERGIDGETTTCEANSATPSEVPSVRGGIEATDHELTQVVQAWPALPAAVRAGIVALVQATKRTE